MVRSKGGPGGQRPTGKPRPAHRTDKAPAGRGPGQGRPPGERADRAPGGAAKGPAAGRVPSARPAPSVRPTREPDGLIVGVHATLAVLRHQPKRVHAVFCWSRDRDVQLQIAAAVAAAGNALRDRAQEIGISTQAPLQLREDHLAQGVAIAVRPFPHGDLDDITASVAPRPGALILALDGITDTHNLGAILRSAAFFDVGGVLIPSDRAAHVTPTTERIARGGASVVPVAIVTNLARSLASLRELGWTIVGTGLEAGSQDLWSLRRDQAIVLVLGAEDRGLRPLVRRHCDAVVRLDGMPTMQSLNVSAFTATALGILRRPGSAG